MVETVEIDGSYYLIQQISDFSEPMQSTFRASARSMEDTFTRGNDRTARRKGRHIVTMALVDEIEQNVLIDLLDESELMTILDIVFEGEREWDCYPDGDTGYTPPRPDPATLGVAFDDDSTE